jgi:hypothetical protein
MSFFRWVGIPPNIYTHLAHCIAYDLYTCWWIKGTCMLVLIVCTHTWMHQHLDVHLRNRKLDPTNPTYISGFLNMEVVWSGEQSIYCDIYHWGTSQQWLIFHVVNIPFLSKWLIEYIEYAWLTTRLYLGYSHLYTRVLSHFWFLGHGDMTSWHPTARFFEVRKAGNAKKFFARPLVVHLVTSLVFSDVENWWKSMVSLLENDLQRIWNHGSQGESSQNGPTFQVSELF